MFVKKVEAPKFEAPVSSGSKAFGSLRPFVSPNKAALEGEVVVYHGGRLGTYDQRKVKRPRYGLTPQMDEICSLVNQSLGSTDIESSRLKNSKVGRRLA